jgi:(1->4)-alpha-D-glucan 1-alpha-D-glucosylmutase
VNAVSDDATLDQLAELAGIEPSFRDYFGSETYVSEDTKRGLLAAMGLAQGAMEPEPPLAPVVVVRYGDPIEIPLRGRRAQRARWALQLEDGSTTGGKLDGTAIRLGGALPLGYHRLRAGDAETTIIVVPERCYAPEETENGRIWALSTQLYALRSGRNWGIGDFADLGDFSELAGKAGAAAVGLNPLHELHPSNPSASSPYAPSSRLFLNGAYIDVDGVEEFRESREAEALMRDAAFVAELEALRGAELVDYGGVAAAKRRMLDVLFAQFTRERRERPTGVRASAFRRFVNEGGAMLHRLAVYEALSEHFRALDRNVYGWLQWPPEYRSPHSGAVVQFAGDQRERVDFYLYLQFLADERLASACERANARGVGFYRDLAVGVDLNGADAWGDQDAILAGASVGAPPDGYNAQGQNWGLPPVSPHALRRRAFAPYVALLRANMRYATVLRIDHVMALRRAFWIPRGMPATQGAYVRYDFEAMLGILALESVRNRCAVVGEDLGTVPEGFRERMQAAGVMSSRLVYFERSFHEATFFPPSSYPRLAAASVGTHDLPPLTGWWLADDITTRERIGVYPTAEAVRSAYDERHYARYMLIDALVAAAAADDGQAWALRQDADRGGTLHVANELAMAVHRFLARTPSMLAVVAIEDVLTEVPGVNVPGTVDEHPNWRRKRTLTLEEIDRDGRLYAIGAVMCDTTT